MCCSTECHQSIQRIHWKEAKSPNGVPTSNEERPQERLRRSACDRLGGERRPSAELRRRLLPSQLLMSQEFLAGLRRFGLVGSELRIEPSLHVGSDPVCAVVLTSLSEHQSKNRSFLKPLWAMPFRKIWRSSSYGGLSSKSILRHFSKYSWKLLGRPWQRILGGFCNLHSLMSLLRFSFVSALMPCQGSFPRSIRNKT